tara:strand:- start:3212 stop:4066 length:855 start_codon:yes stop_codon:yes gene_type:complete
MNNSTKLHTYETLYKDWGQFFRDYEVLVESKTGEQDLLLIDTESFGKVLILDGVVQLTERDNFVYHEMLTHVPLIAHGSAKNVLVIGGGDGGTIHHVLMHRGIEVTMVEIDEQVTEFSKEHLAFVNHDSFSNPRLSLHIGDGAKFVKETAEKFDVIIVDSTDPIGPGEVLFTREFYADCKRCLGENGILVTQNGVPFTQPEELEESVSYFKELFKCGTCYCASVPTYVGGVMAFGFATDNVNLVSQPKEDLGKKIIDAGICSKYYNSDIHQASFALPNFIKEIV